MITSQETPAMERIRNTGNCSYKEIFYLDLWLLWDSQQLKALWKYWTQCPYPAFLVSFPSLQLWFSRACPLTFLAYFSVSISISYRIQYTKSESFIKNSETHLFTVSLVIISWPVGDRLLSKKHNVWYENDKARKSRSWMNKDTWKEKKMKFKWTIPKLKLW